MHVSLTSDVFFFFFNDTATTEIYTLSLHDALPILPLPARGGGAGRDAPLHRPPRRPALGAGRATERRASRPALLRKAHRDRKSTRLNSSHVRISYAVFCLKKKHAQA